MSIPDISVESGLKRRAKVSDVPVARLIGFEAKVLAEERSIVTLAA